MQGGTAAAQHAWWQLLLWGCRRSLPQHAAAGAGADGLQALGLRTCTSASQISSSCMVDDALRGHDPTANGATHWRRLLMMCSSRV
jgi:hypothetical protein